MRISEVLKVKFPHTSFIACDTDLIAQSRTWHSCGPYRRLPQISYQIKLVKAYFEQNNLICSIG